MVCTNMEHLLSMLLTSLEHIVDFELYLFCRALLRLSLDLLRSSKRQNSIKLKLQ